jgi:hypothetical protein
LLLFVGLGRTGKGDTLHCGECGARIAAAAAICRIMGRPPRKTYRNPHGLLCPIVTLSEVENLAEQDCSSAEHTWFAGYAWRPVACGVCGLFLGWRFEAFAAREPGSFWGLLEQRLVSRSAGEG